MTHVAGDVRFSLRGTRVEVMQTRVCLNVLPLANPASKRALKYHIGEYVWICTGYSNRCLNKPPCFLSSEEALEYAVNLTGADGRDHSFNITIN